MELSAAVGWRRQAPWRGPWRGRHRTERSQERGSTPRKECSMGSRQPRKREREHRDCTSTCTNAARVNRSGDRRAPGCAGRCITMKNCARAWRELSERVCCFQAVPPSNMKQCWVIFLDTTLCSAWLLASCCPCLYAPLISFHCMCFNTVFLFPRLFEPTLSAKIQFNTNLSLRAIAWKCTEDTTTYC
nr:LOW QUALITY PROTEIN: putative transcriptional regulator encoded by LINC00473 [Symphalangus syndactylus]